MTELYPLLAVRDVARAVEEGERLNAPDVADAVAAVDPSGVTWLIGRPL